MTAALRQVKWQDFKPKPKTSWDGYDWYKWMSADSKRRLGVFADGVAVQYHGGKGWGHYNKIDVSSSGIKQALNEGVLIPAGKAKNGTEYYTLKG